MTDAKTFNSMVITIKADSVQVDEIMLERITHNYWSDASFIEKFDKYNCKQTLEFYKGDVLLSKFTIKDYQQHRAALQLRHQLWKL